MATADEWWSSPTESENGRTIFVTGRGGIENAMESGKYIYRVDVAWDYNAQPDGMPDDDDAALMEQATDALQSEFKKDKVGIMTGIYTGDGRREWIFYTKNLNIFNKVFNRALSSLPLIPLLISAEEDRDWAEYREMRSISYIAPGD